MAHVAQAPCINAAYSSQCREMLRNVVGRTSRSGCPLGRVLQDPLLAQRNRRAWVPAAGLEARPTINAGVRLREKYAAFGTLPTALTLCRRRRAKPALRFTAQPRSQWRDARSAPSPAGLWHANLKCGGTASGIGRMPCSSTVYSLLCGLSGFFACFARNRGRYPRATASAHRRSFWSLRADQALSGTIRARVRNSYCSRVHATVPPELLSNRPKPISCRGQRFSSSAGQAIDTSINAPGGKS